MYRVWFLSFVCNYLFVLYVFVRPLYSLSGSAMLLILIYIYVQKLHYEREQSINICRLLSPFFFMYVLLFKVAFMSDATLRRGSKSEVTWRYSSVHPLLRLPWHGSATSIVVAKIRSMRLVWSEIWYVFMFWQWEYLRFGSSPLYGSVFVSMQMC